MRHFGFFDHSSFQGLNTNPMEMDRHSRCHPHHHLAALEKILVPQSFNHRRVILHHDPFHQMPQAPQKRDSR
jgi:hypothetical protein